MQTKQYRLPKEFGLNWIKALKSGKYLQGYSYLFATYTNGNTSIDRFCCLGVACKSIGVDNDTLRTEFIPENIGVPNELIGDRSNNKLVEILTNFNDGEKGKLPQLTFIQIAKWIEQNVELY